MNDRQREAGVVNARRDAEQAAEQAEVELDRNDANEATEQARTALRASWRAWLLAVSDEDRRDAQAATDAAQTAGEAAAEINPAWDEQAESEQAEQDARLALAE